MVTTSSNPTAIKTTSGQDNNGKNTTGRAAGLFATATLGFSLLVGGLLSQGHQAAPATVSAGADTPLSQAAQTYAQARFLEQNALPETLGLVQIDGSDALRLWEQNTQLPTTDAPATTTQAAALSGGSYADIVWELEQASRAATVPFVADQLTYREDHRGETPVNWARALPELLLCDTRA